MQVALNIISLLGIIFIIIYWWRWYSKSEAIEGFLTFESEGPLFARDHLIISRRLGKFKVWLGHTEIKIEFRKDQKYDVTATLDRTDRKADEDKINTAAYFDLVTEKVRSEVLAGYTDYFNNIKYVIQYKEEVHNFYNFHIASTTMIQS